MSRILKNYFTPGQKVWVILHPVSNPHRKKTLKFTTKRDGPYVILTKRSPLSYKVSNFDSPDTPIGTYHVSALNSFTGVETTPIAPLRKRGRPKKRCW
ncbi:uncharacterized protein CDAR_561081 [Caerostris darwini]|uniref:Uncharacterized protein n=1 Tax=Caerostris darwini TaxID=1538125 RepID=A0AAV4TEI6_9ARAC|nr:uncharacterized protein CDAR_561081 [Caerostris darwini]